MVKIFSPILHHALIYIDEILLFSHNHQIHQHLLSNFLEIVQTHGIGKESIDFLGMVLKDGHYHPGPPIAAELLKFLDIDLNKKQIQLFLGIVNYVTNYFMESNKTNYFMESNATYTLSYHACLKRKLHHGVRLKQKL